MGNRVNTLSLVLVEVVTLYNPLIAINPSHEGKFNTPYFIVLIYDGVIILPYLLLKNKTFF